MKFIDKVEIQYYRSLKNVSINKLSDVNVFSGRNDVGKSSVLRALDLFFNKPFLDFQNNYNKERLDEVKKNTVKGKQFIKIKVTFNNPGNYKTLPSKFYVTKSWDREGNLILPFKDNIELQHRKGKIGSTSVNKSKTSLTKFLNRIRYIYVPAGKDDHFFSNLLRILQNSLFTGGISSSTAQINDVAEKFNIELGKLTKDLNDTFFQIAGIKSSLTFPTNVNELFERLIIDTKSGEHDIPLRLRGDGIRMRYIPTILNYISENSKKFDIWGFDEPENSCEHSLEKELAELFANEYSKNSQIFVASHSFNFISLEGENVRKFRVFQEESNLNSRIIEINKANQNELQNELGFLEINERLADLYNELIIEKNEIDDLKEMNETLKLPILLFEGPSDNIHFESNFKKLYSTVLSSKFIVSKHVFRDDGSTFGAGAQKLNEYLCNHIARLASDNKIIGIFDFDEQGINEFKALKKSSLYEFVDEAILEFKNVLVHKRFRNVFAITLVPPAHRLNFIDYNTPKYCHLSTEMLYKDAMIPSNNRDYPSKVDRSVFGFKDRRKVNFANDIKERMENGESIDSSGFEDTFELIKKIKEISDI